MKVLLNGIHPIFLSLLQHSVFSNLRQPKEVFKNVTLTKCVDISCVHKRRERNFNIRERKEISTWIKMSRSLSENVTKCHKQRYPETANFTDDSFVPLLF